MASSNHISTVTNKEINNYLTKENTLSIYGVSAPITSSIVFREALIMEALVGSGLYKEGASPIDIAGNRFHVHK